MLQTKRAPSCLTQGSNVRGPFDRCLTCPALSYYHLRGSLKGSKSGARVCYPFSPYLLYHQSFYCSPHVRRRKKKIIHQTQNDNDFFYLLLSALFLLALIFFIWVEGGDRQSVNYCFSCLKNAVVYVTFGAVWERERSVRLQWKPS